jgi:hypothetical protein
MGDVRKKECCQWKVGLAAGHARGPKFLLPRLQQAWWYKQKWARKNKRPHARAHRVTAGALEDSTHLVNLQRPPLLRKGDAQQIVC